MRKSLLMLLLLNSNSLLADSWFCTEGSIKQQGQSIIACGIGMDKSEAKSRLQAFDFAKQEFDKICNNSTNCKNLKINIKPLRTECQYINNEYKCIRALSFEFDEEEMIQVEKSLSKGMSKDDVLEILGSPRSVSEIQDYDSGEIVYQMFFRGSICSFDSCSVLIKNNKVIKFKEINNELVNF